MTTPTVDAEQFMHRFINEMGYNAAKYIIMLRTEQLRDPDGFPTHQTYDDWRQSFLAYDAVVRKAARRKEQV